MKLKNSKTALTNICMLSSIVLVSACGGGASGGNGAVLDTFDAINGVASSQLATYLDTAGQPLGNVTRAQDSVLASQSSGTFDGYIAGAVAGDAFVAALELTVDFADAELTGTASDFRFEDDTVLTGSVMGTGSINAATLGVLPQATLTLTGPLSDASTTRAAQLALDGDFYQAGTEQTGAVAGLVEGNIGDADVDGGVFSAER